MASKDIKTPVSSGESVIDPRKTIKISLRSKIIALIIVVIVIIMAFVYRTILQDEKNALIDSVKNNGGALATLLANNTRIALANALLDKAGSGGITEQTYEKLNYFDLGFSETLDQMIAQKDIVYAAIINKFGKVVGHSKTDHEIIENTAYKALDTIRLYKDAYVDGETLKPMTQDYTGDYYDPKSKKIVTGDVLDVAFPMVVDIRANSIKAYEGEVHIGISKASINQTVRQAEAKLQGVSLLSLLFGIIASILLSSLIISPINKLVAAMGKISNGDLKQKVVVHSKDEVELLATSFNRMTDGLSKYVSAGLVKKLMKQEGLLLGGAYKKMTMMESDIRNFTGTSEKLTPEEVVTYLNEYLDLMTKVIMKFGGEVDKYIGDAIVAHFGIFDPLEANLVEHTKNAVRAAVAMNQAMIPFNEKRQSRGLGTVRMGVGINTGDVILGNMGSTERMDYTVIGDNMNLTARLCDNAGKDIKEDNGNVVHLRNIIITEPTYEMVKDIVVVEDKVVHIRVKGKEHPIKIYQVFDVRA